MKKSDVTFERNNVEWDVILRAERADFDGSIELSFASIAQSKLLQRGVDINFVPTFFHQKSQKNRFFQKNILLEGPKLMKKVELNEV